MVSVILKIEGFVNVYTLAVIIMMVVWFTDVSEKPYYLLGTVTTQRPAFYVYIGTQQDWNRTNCIDTVIASGSFFCPIADIQKEIQEIGSALQPASGINTGTSLLFRTRK